MKDGLRTDGPSSMLSRRLSQALEGLEGLQCLECVKDVLELLLSESTNSSLHPSAGEKSAYSRGGTAHPSLPASQRCGALLRVRRAGRPEAAAGGTERTLGNFRDA